jgi:hypothetical protein
MAHQPRVLHRPRHGWARSRSERVADRLSGGFWFCVFLCWLATVGISVFASTVLLLQDLVAWFNA